MPSTIRHWPVWPAISSTKASPGWLPGRRPAKAHYSNRATDARTAFRKTLAEHSVWEQRVA